MSKKLEQNAAASIDEVDVARNQICNILAKGMSGGTCGFEFRFVRPHQQFTEAWVYFFSEHQWHKQDEFTEHGNVVATLVDQFEMIASREFADDWTCRRVEHSDRVDFELKFRREAVESYPQNGLESFLAGCLFQGHHDSGKDARRRIRFKE
ncbi:MULTISPECIES: hypothetical protein [unclassified Schlesneria]|uniref:hypothetical protein n=1 Tax=unclassified Schlesneria TaxID=2762017 RepID=UPI002F213D63